MPFESGPSRLGAFPRWGYLDKFDSNEYMARALVISVALTSMAFAAWMFASRQEPGHAARQYVLRPVDLQSYVVRGGTPVAYFTRGSHDATRRKSTGLSTPIPVSTPPIEVDPDAFETHIGGGPGADGTKSGVLESGADFAPGSTVDPRPRPDEIVPFEKEPELLGMREPRYPELARDAGIEGEVVVRVLVGTDGMVRDAILAQRVLGLDEAALEAALTAVFKPALQQRHPVAVWIAIPIVFKLHE